MFRLEESVEEQMWFREELDMSIDELTGQASHVKDGGAVEELAMEAQGVKGEEEVDEQAAVEDEDAEETEQALHNLESFHECKFSGVNIAELSTGDEALIQSGETAEESLEEEEAEEEEEEVDEEQAKEVVAAISWYQASSALPAPEDTRALPCPQESGVLPAPQANYMLWSYVTESQATCGGSSHDDAWMTPFGETMRSQKEAEQVYGQLQDMLANAEAAKSMQYQPVLCSENQQLYTDGQQLYMLACIDEAQGLDDSGPVLMRPVVDAYDPLHAEFAKDACHGLDRLPVRQERDVCMLPPQPVERRLFASQEGDAWDVCW